MRILQVIAETRLGGAESFGFMLSAELARRGHEILLLSTYANGPLFERERPDGMEVCALERRGRADPSIYSFLIGSIRRFRPDLIHGHNFAANSWVRLMSFLFPRIPVVCHEHSGKKVRQRKSRLLVDRLLHRRSAAVFAVSHELHELLLDRYGIDRERLHDLPNGIDVDRYTPPRDAQRRTKEVVCVANLSRVKNHEGLLRAWEKVVAEIPDAHLTLLGEGRLRDALERQARAAGIEGSVTFVGRQEDVRPYLWNASVFVLPSHREGMPLSLLEAMAAGLPSVVSAVGEMPDIVEEGKTGRLVPPGDVDALADGLSWMLRNVDQASEMGRAGQMAVAQRYDLKSCVDEIERVYRSLLGAPSEVPEARKSR